MPATYEPIATTTLGSAAATITFSSIPGTYTDLRLVFVGRTDTVDQFFVRINNDSSLLYSLTELHGTGSTAASGQRTSRSSLEPIFPQSFDTTYPTFVTMDFFSYAGSTFKTCLSTGSQDINAANGIVVQTVGLYRSTSAISSLVLFPVSGTFNVGSIATLYGILKA